MLIDNTLAARALKVQVNKLKEELVNIYSVALMGSEWNATVRREKVGPTR